MKIPKGVLKLGPGQINVIVEALALTVALRDVASLNITAETVEIAKTILSEVFGKPVHVEGIEHVAVPGRLE